VAASTSVANRNAAVSIGLSRALTALQPGDHLCCLYATEAEHRAVVTTYLRAGLERGEKILYIVDSHTAATVLDYLRADGVAVADHQARGQLTILGSEAAYLRTGVFDPAGMIALLRAETERAVADGFPALCVTGEMTWALRGLPGSDRLIEYEAHLNDFLPDSRCVALCQYDLRRFEPTVLLDVIRTHPRVVVGEVVCDNPYYVPPATLLGADRAAADLHLWLQNLTARQRGEDALHSTEAGYRRLFDNAPVGVFQSTPEGKFITLNPALARMLKYESPDELVAHVNRTSIAEALYTEPETRRCLIAATAATPNTWLQTECCLRCRDGSTIVVNLYLQQVPADAELPTRLLGFVEDISERKRAADEIAAQRHFYESILQSIREGVWVTDQNDTIIFINQGMLNIAGVNRADAVGRNVLTGFSEATLCEFRPFYLRARETLQPTPYETQVVTPAGRLSWQSGWLIPRVEGGQFAGMICTILDITDRRQVEEQLRAGAALLQATEHLTRVGGWMWEVAAQRMTWTPELYRIHGLAPDDFQPGSPEHIARSLACYDEADRETVLSAFQRCASEGQPYDLQVPFTNARGERLWVRTTAQAVWEGDKVVAVVGNLHDITDHRRAEEALERSLAEKEVLLREVHHRVKNNLASIIGLLELQTAAVDDARLVGVVREVGHRIKAMAIVHELLYQSESLSEIDLHRYLTALVSGLPAAFGRSHGVHIDIESAAVPMSLDTAIPCGLIVNELVTNALKHAFPEGKPRPGADECRVVIRADWDGTYYTLQVADNGIGLPADLDWTATRTLGLRLVTMLGRHQLQGEIELDRSNGTDFRLRFAPIGGQRR
jgi:PAS domain S-box-containing protein